MIYIILILMGAFALSAFFISILVAHDGVYSLRSGKRPPPPDAIRNESEIYELPDIEKDPLAIEINRAAHKAALVKRPPTDIDFMFTGLQANSQEMHHGERQNAAYLDLAKYISKLYKSE